jgi:peptide/nickel transport system ATP-binding protein
MAEIMIDAKSIIKDFKITKGLFLGKENLRAVDGVSLQVSQGEVLAIVGESGCGKTTLAKILLGLLKPDSGSVELCGFKIDQIPRLKLAKTVQPIFQDPYSSLNPRKTIGSIITLPMRVQVKKKLPSGLKELSKQWTWLDYLLECSTNTLISFLVDNGRGLP